MAEPCHCLLKCPRIGNIDWCYVVAKNDLQLGAMTLDKEKYSSNVQNGRQINTNNSTVCSLFFAVRGDYNNLIWLQIIAEQVIHEVCVQQIQRNIQIKHIFFNSWRHITEWVLLCWAQGSANRIPMASTCIPCESGVQPPKSWQLNLLLWVHGLGAHR
jgi:hypothetical protein